MRAGQQSIPCGLAVKIEAYLSPADYQAQAATGYGEAVCVVLDVLRATSVMVAGLANGAAGFVPTAEIATALALRHQHPNALLAGERDGRRITSAQSGGVDFDLGNSPREYTAAAVRDRHIVTTTTNGTRAFAACRGAKHLFAGSFLNLTRTAQQILRSNCEEVILVCSGTGEAVAFEDCLGAGALCHQLLARKADIQLGDSASFTADLYTANAGDLEGALEKSSNARRLLAIPELGDDVAFCMTANLFPIVVAGESNGRLHRIGAEQV